MKLGIMIKRWNGKKPSSSIFSDYISPHLPYDHPTTYRGGNDGFGKYVEAHYYFTGSLYAIDLGVQLNFDDATVWDSTVAYISPLFSEHITGPKHFYTGGQAYVNAEDRVFYEKTRQEHYLSIKQYITAMFFNNLKIHSIQYSLQENQDSTYIWITIQNLGNAIDLLNLLSKNMREYEITNLFTTAIKEKQASWEQLAEKNKIRNLDSIRLIPNNEKLYAREAQYCACEQCRLDYGFDYSVIRHPISRQILLAWGGKSVGTTISGVCNENSNNSANTPVAGTSIPDPNGISLDLVKCCGKIAQDFVLEWNAQKTAAACRQILIKTASVEPLQKIRTYLTETIAAWDKHILANEIPQQLAIEKELRRKIFASELQRINACTKDTINEVSLTKLTQSITKEICEARKMLKFWGAELLPVVEQVKLTTQEIVEVFSAVTLNHTINVLDIAEHNLNYTIDVLIKLLTTCQAITTINLANTNLNNEALTKLQPLLIKNPRLKKLNLTGLTLSPKILEQYKIFTNDAEQIVNIPDDYRCPISKLIMLNPVVTADGESYEQEEIEKRFFLGDSTNPKTNLALEHTTITPNKTLKNAIQAFLDINPFLRDSNEIYFSAKLQQEIITAITSKQLDVIDRLTSIDRRLLIRPLDNAQSLINLACDSNAEIFELILKKLGSKIWTLPAVSLNNGQQLLAKIFTGLGIESAKLFANTLEWTVNDWQLQLELAIIEENIGLMELCIQSGAKLDVPNSTGDYPLHQAVLNNKPVIVQAILAKQTIASSNIINNAGNTPLHLAAKQGNLVIAKLLLEKGADSKVTNEKQPKYPVTLAIDAGFINMATEFEKIRYRLKYRPLVEEIVQPLRQEIARMQAQVLSLQQYNPITVGYHSAANSVTNPSVENTNVVSIVEKLSLK